MARLLLRAGLWCSLAAAVVAVFLGMQQPLQEIFMSLLALPSPSQTFCYEGGVTAKFSTDTKASCFTVKDGVFVDVFTPTSVPPVEPRHGHAIPGLWDGHGHLAQYGEFLHSVDLFGASSIDDVHARLAAYLSEHPGAGGEDDWIRGVGWDQMALGFMPTAAMLESDERLRGRYVLLDRVDVHCVWVSQAVLDLLPADLPDVPGGEVVRDPGPGVLCDNAADLLVAPLRPRPGPARRAAFLRAAAARLHSLGLVGVHDAGAGPDELRLCRELARGGGGGGDWALRVYAMVECRERNTFCPEEFSGYFDDDDDDDGFLRVKSVKLFADGALGSWGSAMLEPYADRPDASGSLLVNASTLTALARSWSAEGYQVNIHAIGDLANRLAVDALSAALADLCPDDASPSPLSPSARETALAACQARRRFRIEHAQIIHPADQARIRRLGLLPSVQPTHATSDMAYAGRRLGPARLAAEAYRMRSLAGGGLVLGSDFPVEPADPLRGVYAAVARRSPATGRGADGRTREPWFPEEALGLREALAGFTEGPAYGAFLEGRAGVIQPGAWADWVVLDRPLEEVDIEDLRALKVRETWVGGRRVYARE